MITAARYWAAAATLPMAGLAEIAPGRALVLAPHPDDESLGCGGLIAEACATGCPPLVVMLTDGAGSHPGSRKYPAERRRALREAETLAAVAVLGMPADHVVFLGYPDTAAPSTGAGLREATDRVAALLRRHGCDTILAPWQYDPHCDHEAAHRIASLLARDTGVRHQSYPVWGLTLPAGHELDRLPTGVRLDVSRHRTVKRQAILAHASQHAGLIDDDPNGFQMQPGFMALFDTATELYLDPV